MDSPQVKGALLVGSTPLATEEECKYATMTRPSSTNTSHSASRISSVGKVETICIKDDKLEVLVNLSIHELGFRLACKMLPNHLARISSGEPGKRGSYLGWQIELFQHEPRLLSEMLNPDGPASFTKAETNEILKAIPKLETKYDDFALSSCATFRRLRDEGVIPNGVRFSVCLPTPLDLVALMIRPPFQAHVERLYEDAMLRSLDRLLEGIPHTDLTIQWDIPMPFAIIDGGGYMGAAKAWFEPEFEGIIARMVRNGAAVPKGVELDYHFCYGT